MNFIGRDLQKINALKESIVNLLEMLLICQMYNSKRKRCFSAL